MTENACDTIYNNTLLKKKNTRDEHWTVNVLLTNSILLRKMT